MRILFVALVAFMLCTACISDTDTNSNTNEPDYGATATTLIANATQTAVNFRVDDCEMIEATDWQISIFFDGNGEMETERSGGRNTSLRSNWLCDDGYQYDHLEYHLDIFIETEDVDFVTLIDEVVTFLQDYPPDDIPPLESLILLSLIQPSASMFPAEQYTLNYDETMQVFESGLSGQELLDAVATPVE